VHRLLRAYQPVRRFVCPSRFLAAKIAQGGVYPERLRVLPNFVETRGVAVKQHPGGPVLYAGRLSYEKGVDVLVQAVARLGSARLEVAGDGPERPALEALAAAVAPGRVRFLGQVPKPRLLELMRAAAVVALPSRCHENQPMAVLEAFASGVPVVASSLGGLPELVEPGLLGDITPPDDPAALAAPLARLLDDPRRAQAMGRAARATAEERFAPERHLGQLERLYQEAHACLPA
jgi:glycosyltransferase involved in cell wall biosynthesis